MYPSFRSLVEKQELAICVDDFGLTPGINQAVIELAKLGKINCTSVLVDGPALKDEHVIEELLMLHNDKKIQLGLHLNFTELLSDKQNPDLVAPISQLLFTSKFCNKEKIEAIYAEIERQFYAFEAEFDRYPDYIDGHQHVHMLPAIFSALKKFYKENRLDQNDIWIRSLNRVHKLNKTKLPGASQYKNLILRFATKKAKSSVFSLRRELLGVYDFQQNQQDYLELLRFWLGNARNYITSTKRGAVIMVHPSSPHCTETVDYDDRIAQARLVEYQALSMVDFDALEGK